MDSHCYHLVRNDAEQPPKHVIDTSVEYGWPDRNIPNEVLSQKNQRTKDDLVKKCAGIDADTRACAPTYTRTSHPLAHT